MRPTSRKEERQAAEAGRLATLREYMNEQAGIYKQYDTFFEWYQQSEDKAKFLVTASTFMVGVVNG
jgi:hypothetical protein